MPGYEIVEQRYLKPHKEDGVAPNEIRMGCLDFLREIKNGAEAIPRLSSFTVVGIDEVLYMTRPEDKLPIARAIHKILQKSAQILDRKLLQVQIVCKGKLIRGDTLWIEYRREKLPIDFIFGSPLTREIRDIHVYTTGFNLST